MDPFPHQETISQAWNSIQTYINYHKTHAMATHYGGMGDTSMENLKSQDIDRDSQEIIRKKRLSHFNI